MRCEGVREGESASQHGRLENRPDSSALRGGSYQRFALMNAKYFLSEARPLGST